MAGNGYHLQYLLYTVALHRMLQRRQPDYDYDRHVGGVHYLFMRGVRPDWVSPQNSSPGVHFDRPARTTIEALDRLLGGEGPTRPDGTQA
jgi:exodeoxyribonuclease V beta subunit